MTTTTTDTKTVDPMSVTEASRYQQLSGHLAALNLATAAEALPGLLDAARAEKLTLTTALERLSPQQGGSISLTVFPASLVSRSPRPGIGR